MKLGMQRKEKRTVKRKLLEEKLEISKTESDDIKQITKFKCGIQLCRC